jgi:serine/threonine protein kinase
MRYLFSPQQQDATIEPMPRAKRASSTKQKCPGCGASIETASALPLAQVPCPKCGKKVRAERTFDHFVLIETLGIGGMGAVYKARDTLRDYLVAVKLLRTDLGNGVDHTVQLQEEARLAASVNHPNVVRVLSWGTDHGQVYLVMELIDGGSLDDLIERQKSLPEEQVLQAGIQVAKGLRAAHAKGLIHSDVKPANILFVDEHTAKISDFGLAGIAAQNPKARAQIWGTPYYVAPERLNNHPEDLRSDIYSLGATLFHALSGKPPIQAETNSAAKLRKLKYQPLDLPTAMPNISEETARVFHRMLAPDPAQRFSSYDEVVTELEAAKRAVKRAQKAEVERALRELKEVERAQRGWRRQIGFAAALLVIAALVAGGIVFVGRKPGAVSTARDTLGAIMKKFAARTSISKPGTSLNDQSTDPSASDAAAQKKVGRPMLAWDVGLAQYKERLARYDFLGAAAVIANTQANDRSLQIELGKKAQWLAAWKNNLIADLNAKQFSGEIADLDQVRYHGIVGANPERVMLKTRYGIVGLPWPKLPSKKLLAVSASFIWPDTREAADRQWLCAAFASATGQIDEARQFAEAAAKAQPQYRDEIPLLLPTTSAAR